MAFAALTVGLAGIACSDRGNARPASGEPAPGLGAELEAVTGAHTRVVWATHQNKEKGDPYMAGNSHLLVGFDSRDGEGVRIFLEKKDNYSRPLITPDGKSIIYSDKNIERKGGKKLYKPEIFVLPWGGGRDEVEKLGKGLAVDVWRDPETGRQWVYGIDKMAPSDRVSPEGGELFRFPLDAPKEREVVFKGKISPDNVQVSRDGRTASGLFPWPKGGIIDLESGKWRQNAHGCWPSIAPDDSGISWVFDGAHRTARMFGPAGRKRWAVKLNTGPGIDGSEVYHPRWSNDPRIITVTGPYGGSAKSGNPISKSAPTADVYVGRFDDRLTKVEKWVRLTDDDLGDFYPDVWVSGGEEIKLAAASIVGSEEGEGTEADGGGDAVAAAWPGAEDALAFRWLHDQAENRIGDRDCSVAARGIGRFGRGYGMLVDGGWYEVDAESAGALHGVIAAGDGVSISFVLSDDGPPTSGQTVALAALASASGAPLVAIHRTPEGVALRRGDQDVLTADWAEADGDARAMPGTSWTATLSGTDAALFCDGEIVAESEEAPPFELPDGALRLAFGDPGGDPAYRGRLAGVTVHGGTLDAESVAGLHAGAAKAVAEAEGGDPPSRLVVRGKLVEAAAMPSVESLDTYSRALFDFTYEVEEVVAGEYSEPRIVVWHWAILDRQPLPDALREIGRTYELVVEPASAHPELEGERRTETTSEFSLDPFYDVATPPKPGT